MLKNEPSTFKEAQLYQDIPNDCRSICSESNNPEECLSSPKSQDDDEMVPIESLSSPTIPRFMASSPSQISCFSEEDLLRSSTRKAPPTLLSPIRIHRNLKKKKSQFLRSQKSAMAEKNKLGEVKTLEGHDVIEDPSEIIKSTENERLDSQLSPIDLFEVLKKVNEDNPE